MTLLLFVLDNKSYIFRTKIKLDDMRLIIFILAMVMVYPAFGQRKKRSDEEAVVTYVEGITYSLPRTGVRIKVKALKEFFQPGPYASYAGQLLGINEVKTSESVKWSITGIEIQTFSEPDPEQVYKAMGEGAYNLSLTPEGCLAGVNIPGGNFKSSEAEVNSYLQNPGNEEEFLFADFNDTPLYVEGDSTNNYRPVRVGAETKAAQAAARIFECRLSRFHMAAGFMDEFHPDGEAYKVSLEQLNNIEKNYLSLFTGRTTRKTEVFSFDFIPGPSSEKGDVVFRFSEDNGVVPASDLSGKPVVLKVEPEKNLTNKYSAMVKSDNPSAGESGVFYRMPAIATVNIIYELKTVASSRIVLPQFGLTAPVPEELLYGGYRIEIHPETGAVRSVMSK